MESINSRFKELRKECQKTQTEWGKILGIKTSGVSDIENERRSVTEQHLIMLSNWKERLVNIEWLRTGVGEMFLTILEEDELAGYCADICIGKSKLLESLILEYMHLDDSEQAVVEKLFKSVSKRMSEDFHEEG